MKRFDAASLRLVIGATLLAVAIVAIPVLQNGRTSSELWKSKGRFYARASVVCDEKSSSVGIFDGLQLTEFNLNDGKFLTVWSPKRFFGESSVLSPDGGRIVSAHGAAPLDIYDVATQAVRRKIPMVGTGANGMKSVHFVSSEHAVVSQSGQIERSQGIGVAIDLQSGNTTRLPARILYQSCVAFAETPKGELQFGWLDGKKLHFETAKGNVKELPLDPRDLPDRTECSKYGYFMPTTLFDRSQNTLFSSIQYESSLHGGRGRTGSLCAWNWKSSAMKWRWQETDVQPVVMALSPDEKTLAVGCTVAIAGSYRRGVRLVILDAQTGQVKQEIRRNRGVQNKWQQFVGKVRPTPDEISGIPDGLPAVAGLDWTDDGQSLVVAYADGEVIRWRV